MASFIEETLGSPPPPFMCTGLHLELGLMKCLNTLKDLI